MTEFKSPEPPELNNNPLFNAVKSVVSSVSEMVLGTKTKTEVITSDTACAVPEYESLCYDERQLLTASDSRLLMNLRELTLKSSYGCSVEDYYNKVVEMIPTNFISNLTAQLCKYESIRNRWFSADDSYETILKKYMDIAKDLQNPFWTAFDSANTACKHFDVVIKVINKFSKTQHKTINCDIIPIKPFLLAFVWGSLLLELVLKYSKSCVDFEKERIAKLSISLVIALFVGFTGYAHSGGYIGVPSVTSWIRTYYNAQNWFKNSAPYYYSKVPDFLKFPNCHNFDSLVDSMQITAAKGLNMVYTFRIGDSFLSNIGGHSVVSEGVVKEALYSVWPLPQEEESRKVYRIYANEKLYYI